MRVIYRFNFRKPVPNGIPLEEQAIRNETTSGTEYTQEEVDRMADVSGTRTGKNEHLQ